MPDTTSPEFFERMYRSADDPWRFATSAYERERYAALLAALPKRPFARAFEPGCSVGVLTSKLAAYCQWVEAIDISPTAVDRARERCRGLLNVKVACGTLPEALPPGTFDLIVFSEIGYYFSRDGLTRVIRVLVSRLRSGGILLAAHWLGYSLDHLLSGDEVHETIAADPRLEHGFSARHDHFRLDIWDLTA